MTPLTLVDRLRAFVSAYSAQLRFCLRMTVVGLVAFALAQVLDIPLHGLWMVLTALVVTQMSAGGSLRATLEYLVGTLSGAVYAAIIGVFIPHATVLAQAGVLVLAVAPLAFAAALSPSFRVAPFSAVLVLLISGELGEGPIESAFIRFAEVALGGVIAVTISLVVFPQRAHGLGVKAAVNILQEQARLVPELLTGFMQPLDADSIRRRQDEIGRDLARFQAIAAEIKHELFTRLVSDPDPGPLSRTLLRLRHDLVIVGRAGTVPLPDSVAPRLAPALTGLGAAASEFLSASATALSLRRPPPSRDHVDAALQAYSAEVAALRHDGVTRSLGTDETERLFALGFALDELCRNFSDLDRCIKDYAQKPR